MADRLKAGGGAGVAALLAASLLVALGLTEAGYRVTRRWVCVGGMPGFSTPRAWGWTHEPGAALWAWGCVGRRFEWRTWIEINAQGLRDVARVYERRAGEQRVLLLGDSITEALQVPLDRTFAKRAEDALRAGGRAVDVINAGHSGFGTDSELLYYRDEGDRYAPDLVVQVLNLENDVVENYPPLHRRAYAHASARFTPKPTFRLGPDGGLELVPISEPDWAAAPRNRRTAWRAIASQFFLLRALERVVTRPPTGTPDSSALAARYELYAPENETWTDAWRLTRALTRALRREVEANGRRFAVVLVPTRDMVAGADLGAILRAYGVDGNGYELDRPRRTARAFLAAEGISVLDLFPVLQAATTAAAPTFYGWDVHLNERGHAAVGPALAAFVRDQLSATLHSARVGDGS